MRKLSDKALAAKARQYKRYKAAADIIAGELLAELEHRGVKIGEHVDVAGVRLRHKQYRRRKYSVAALRALLRPKQQRLVIVPTVDLSALDELVRSHQITGDQAAACLEGYVEGATWADVHLLTDEAA